MMHMTDVKSVNWLGVIAIIGALLMIIGVFLSWYTVSGMGESETASGWEIATDGDGVFNYSYAPYVSLVCGIICLIGMIVPMVLPAKNIGKGLSILGLILAIVTIIVAALYASDAPSLNLGDLGRMGVGAGVWVVIVGAVLTVIGGIIDFFVKPKQSEPEQQKPEEPEQPSEPA